MGRYEIGDAPGRTRWQAIEEFVAKRGQKGFVANAAYSPGRRLVKKSVRIVRDRSQDERGDLAEMRAYRWIAFIAVNGCLTTFSYADQTYRCSNGSLQREISVVYDDQAKKLPCEVQYYKDSGAMKVWRSTSMAGYCEGKAEELLKQQQTLGWTCSGGQ